MAAPATRLLMGLCVAAALSGCDPEGERGMAHLLERGQSKQPLTLGPAEWLDALVPSFRDGAQTGPLDIGSDGNGYLVCWLESSAQTLCTRTDSDGTPIGVDPIAVAPAAAGRFLTWTGSQYVVASTARRTSAFGYVASRISSAGLLLGQFVVLPDPNLVTTGASLATVSGSLLVAWREGGSGSDTVRAAVSDQDGGLIPPAGVALSSGTLPASTWPELSLASNGSLGLVVWLELSTDGGTHVAGSVVEVDAGVTPLASFSLSSRSGQVLKPVAAAGDGGFLVAWEDVLLTDTDIFGSRVTSTGVVVDPSAVPLATGSSAQYQPSIVGIGTDYVLAWDDVAPLGGPRSVQSVRFSDPANIPAPMVLLPSGGLGDATLGFNGTSALVAWESAKGVDGTRLDLDGGVLNPGGRPITVQANGQSEAKIAAGGGRYLVVWNDDRFLDGGPQATNIGLYAMRLDSNGTRLDATPMLLSELGPTSIGAYTPPLGSLSQPAVAFDGQDFVVQWWNRDLMLTRVSVDGVVQQPPSIVVADGGWENPLLACGDLSCLSVWTQSFASVAGAWSFPDAGVSASPVVLISGLYEHRPLDVVFGDGRFWLMWGVGTEVSDMFLSTATPSTGVADGGTWLGQFTGWNTDGPIGVRGIPGPDGVLYVWSTGHDPRVPYDPANFRANFVDWALRPAWDGGIALDAGRVWQPTGAWTGQSYAVAWDSLQEMAGTELTPGLAVVPDAGFAFIDTAGVAFTQPQLAWNGNRGLLVYLEGEALLGPATSVSPHARLRYRMIQSDLPPADGPDAGSPSADGGESDAGDGADGGDAGPAPAPCACHSAPLELSGSLGFLWAAQLLRRWRGARPRVG